MTSLPGKDLAEKNTRRPLENPKGAPEALPVKTGVILMNTGTPDAPTVERIGAYLEEFLMDPLIIRAPRFIRKRIVRRIVNKRPAQMVACYESFWTAEGSPFLNSCQAQERLLEEQLSAQTGHHFPVRLAMRYGKPSITRALQQLRALGCQRIVSLPAYPQEVRVCAGTCQRELRCALKKLGWDPSVVEVNSFYDQPAYREALARQVRAHWMPEQGSKLIISCHSTLLSDIKKGDPYQKQVEETARNLCFDLGLSPDDVLVAYQSQFDNRAWLHPLVDEVLEHVSQNGVKKVALVCPVFVADNIETQVEINRNLRATFLKAAGEGASFTYIPCLNQDAGLIAALACAVTEAL